MYPLDLLYKTIIAGWRKLILQRLYSCEKFRQVSLLALALLSSENLVPAFADAVEEYTAKSVLALNLARFTDWPSEVDKGHNGTIHLCVLGDTVVQDAFILIDKKQIDHKTLSVLNINKRMQLNQCHVLYIGAETINPKQFFEESQYRHVLTIGETDDFLEQGGMVYLEMTDTKINLHINLRATQEAGVRISSRVLKLATIINS